MGEYYKFVNLMKREYIDPNNIGFASPYSSGGHNEKESSFLSNVLSSFCLYLLLYGANDYDFTWKNKDGTEREKAYRRRKINSKYRGRWAGDPVMYLGDDLDAVDSKRFFQQYNLKPKKYTESLSQYVSDNFTNISEHALPEFLRYSRNTEYYYRKEDKFTFDETYDVVHKPAHLFEPSTVHFEGCPTLTDEYDKKDPPGTIFVTEKMLLTENIGKYFGNEAATFNQCGECFIPFRIKTLRARVAGMVFEVRDFVNNRLDIVERSFTQKNYELYIRDMDVKKELTAIAVGLDYSDKSATETQYDDFIKYWLK